MNGVNGSFGHSETQKTKRKPKSDIKFQISLNEEQIPCIMLGKDLLRLVGTPMTERSLCT